MDFPRRLLYNIFDRTLSSLKKAPKGQHQLEENMFRIEKTTDLDTVRELFMEYSAIKGAEICFVSFQEELEDLSAAYEGGAMFLAECDGAPAGCVALKKIDQNCCEIKRLYLRPAFRGNGFSKIMLTRILDEARQLGFRTATLSTLPAVMPEAFRLYQDYGFKTVYEEDGIVDMELAI